MLNTVIEGAFKWAYSHACKYRFFFYLPLLIQTLPSFLDGKPVCMCSTQNQFSEEDKFPMSYILVLNWKCVLYSQNFKKWKSEKVSAAFTMWFSSWIASHIIPNTSGI